MLMPSWAFCMATLKPPTWARSFSLMDRPAASSAARLMRKPEESFSRLLDRLPCVSLRWRYAFIASTFWLMRRPIVSSLIGSAAPILRAALVGAVGFPAVVCSIGRRRAGMRLFRPDLSAPPRPAVDVQKLTRYVPQLFSLPGSGAFVRPERPHP